MSQETAVRTRHGTMDWFKTGKGVCQGCRVSPCLFNFYAEYIMQNVRLDESQAGIKISVRNITNPSNADDTTLMVESEEEQQNLLMRLKEESEKAGLKLNLKKLRSWHLVPSAAVAKLLQLCLTLFNPLDYSLPGSSVRRILQA